MKMKRIALFCVLCLVLGMLSACAGNSENIAPIEKVYSKTYSASSVKPTAVCIDGVLDEEIWSTLGRWQNTKLMNDIGVLAKVTLTAFPTDEGIYFASVAYDTNLTSNGYQYPATNSNWEMYFSVCSDEDSLFDSEHIGVYSMRKIFVGMCGEVSSLYADIDRAVVVEGELGSGMTTSATLEMFVPWATIGYDVEQGGVPSSFGILPCYRYVAADSSETIWMAPIDGNIASTSSAYIFDKTGYINADNTHPDSVVGDGAYGYSKSRGWDYSQIDEGIIQSTRGGVEKIFFRGMYGSNFIVETTVVPVTSGGIAGISFIQANGNVHSAFLPLSNLVETEDGGLNFPDYSIRSTLGGDRSESVMLSGYNTTNSKATKTEGVKLTVVKYGTQFWYFADGKYLTTQTISEMDSDCMPGLYSDAAKACYKDYSCTEITKAQAKAYLAEYGIDAFGES